MLMLPVATAIQHGRVSKLRRHVAICRRGNILKTFLMKMGESSLMTKTLISRRIIKKQCSLGKVQKKPEKNGKKEIDGVVWAWLRRYAGGGICCLLQAHTWAKKQIKLKSLRIDGNPRKRKRVVICKQVFPANGLPVRCAASEHFAAKN